VWKQKTVSPAFERPDVAGLEGDFTTYDSRGVMDRPLDAQIAFSAKVASQISDKRRLHFGEQLPCLFLRRV